MAFVTIGSTDYTTYSDVADADEHFNGSTNYATWAAFTPDDKARGLVSSTRLLERQAWQGAKEDDCQQLDYPRTGLTDCEGNALDADDTTAPVIEASQLLALDILSGEEVETSRSTEDLTKRLKAGSVEIENFRGDALTSGGRFPVNVMELIGCFLSGSAAAISGSISSGTDGEALNDDFSLNKGI